MSEKTSKAATKKPTADVIEVIVPIAPHANGYCQQRFDFTIWPEEAVILNRITAGLIEDGATIVHRSSERLVKTPTEAWRWILQQAAKS